MMKPTIIINEQHTLLPSQTELLLNRFGVDGWNTLCVPKDGWTKEDMDREMAGPDLETRVVVFVSPIGYMIKSLSFDSALNHAGSKSGDSSLSGKNTYVEEVLVMANDRREKKELPNGKVISVTAQTGWYLV